MIAKYGEDTSQHPPIDQGVWMDVVGPTKKGRIHGMGDTLDMGFHGSSSSHTYPPSTSAPPTSVGGLLPDVMQQLSQMLETLVDRCVGAAMDRIESLLHLS